MGGSLVAPSPARCQASSSTVGCSVCSASVASPVVLPSVARALGMLTIAHDPFIDIAEPDVRLVGADELWHRSDVVTLHAPATPTTRHVVDAAALAAMRLGSFLINCARGSLVDHGALLDALDRGHIAGAGLDVTEPEPLPADHPLRRHPRVVITPHIASHTAVGRLRLYAHAIDNALAVLAGEPGCVVPEQCEPGEEHAMTMLRERWQAGRTDPRCVAGDPVCRHRRDDRTRRLRLRVRRPAARRAGLRQLRGPVPSGADRRFPADRTGDVERTRHHRQDPRRRRPSRRRADGQQRRRGGGGRPGRAISAARRPKLRADRVRCRSRTTPPRRTTRSPSSR